MKTPREHQAPGGGEEVGAARLRLQESSAVSEDQTKRAAGPSPWGPEGKLGVALESLQGLRDLT